MLRANHAVRLGLRSASRNPELAFGKGLLDALGTALSALPWALAAMLVAAALDRSDAARALVAAARAAFSMRWAIAGGVLAAALLSWTLGMAFWSGALPVLAADAELGRRPPPGHFWPLALRGFPRVAAAGIEVARHGALAAPAADAEGLIETPPEPPPPAPVPTVLERPEPVIEALPVIDALPAPPPEGEKK